MVSRRSAPFSMNSAWPISVARPRSFHSTGPSSVTHKKVELAGVVELAPGMFLLQRVQSGDSPDQGVAVAVFRARQARCALELEGGDADIVAHPGYCIRVVSVQLLILF